MKGDASFGTMKPAHSNHQPLVLVVDDHEDARESYARVLAANGYRAEAAANGLEALDKAVALQPDLIVMDLSMPGLNGWEATRRLKMMESTQEIPVIAVTAHVVGHAREVALAAGCDAFLTKPCFPEDLLREVARLLKPR
ncbi:MAG TPA: response regulator [Vicinamibacteria bacterium]|jgi:CheY-like chemotaxis protein